MSIEETRLTVQQRPNGWTIAGEIDAYSAPSLAEALRALPDVPEVVADFAGVTFMDSSGLRVLVAAANSATDVGKQFAIAHPQPAVKRVVEISGLVGRLRLVD